MQFRFSLVCVMCSAVCCAVLLLVTVERMDLNLIAITRCILLQEQESLQQSATVRCLSKPFLFLFSRQTRTLLSIDALAIWSPSND